MWLFGFTGLSVLMVGLRGVGRAGAEFSRRSAYGCTTALPKQFDDASSGRYPVLSLAEQPKLSASRRTREFAARLADEVSATDASSLAADSPSWLARVVPIPSMS